MLEYKHETEKHREELEVAQKKYKDLKDECASTMELTKKLIEEANMCRANAEDDIGNVNKQVEELNDELAKKNEELVQKDKDFEERKKYNVWLEHPDLDYSFLGPTMIEWIEDFKIQRVKAEKLQSRQ
ncbi:hypothetical protein ACOSP7_015103 [Xanthoceras sorbifolium]